MDMEVSRIIFERGLTVIKVEDEWHLQNVDGGNTFQIVQPEIVSTLYHVRPIVKTVRMPNTTDNNLLLRNNMERDVLFGPKITNITQLAIRANVLVHKGLNLTYLLQAVEYHCLELCMHYAEICGKLAHNSYPVGNAETVIYQAKPEPYFEFDALITAIRRTYDSCRYLMWEHFGNGTGSMPRSFYKTLPLCKSLPLDVYQRLNSSWLQYGRILTEYRDCIQHYVSLHRGMGEVYGRKLDIGVWSCNAQIPDNPSVQSQSKFTYSKRLDALTYGWEAANEILDVVVDLMNVIASQQKGESYP